MPAATPRKKKTIIPHGRVPSQRSSAQPNPTATTIDTTNSTPIRSPTAIPLLQRRIAATIAGRGFAAFAGTRPVQRSPSRARPVLRLSFAH